MKKLTLLHTNDMHGDFFETVKDGIRTGGISRLKGYVDKVRSEEENTIYAMAGDMFRGSMIDSDYLGVSTIDLVNLLAPDIACLGNHEVDYGIAHLLFLEKCARFPIICSNVYVTMNNTRLFTPCMHIETGGMKVLFIGILTREILASAKTEKVIGSLIDVQEAARQVGIICDNYRTTDTDMTVLLTHIGIEQDRQLADILDPAWGVDLIIGGHSHTAMEKAEVINGYPIVQAASGTAQIGRFDILYDDENKKIADWKWQCIPINENLCEQDPTIEEVLEIYQQESEFKYRRIVTRLARKLTHPTRIQETELGNLYADMMQDDSSFDIMLFGSGAIRKKEFGPLVEYADMLENTPFDDMVYMLEVTGAQFRKMVLHILRDDAWEGHTEFYQYSKGVHIVYCKRTHTLEEFKFNGEDIKDDMRLKIAIQEYHYSNFDEFFGVPLEEVKKNRHPRIVMTSVNNIVEEYMTLHQGLDAHVEGRLVILD